MTQQRDCSSLRIARLCCWRLLGAAAACLVAACNVGQAEATPGIAGDWMDPTGSVVRIAPCGSNYCAQIVELTGTAPATTDKNNPDSSLRSRPLCGLVIGTGFHLVDPLHADGGSLYDPRTGRTYHGLMSREGSSLELRGYVAFKLFGRSETWHQTKLVGAVCGAKSK